MVKSFAALSVTLLFVVAAQAQPQRVFVSGAGLDTNDCLLADPCRTFDRAIAAVADGGEIVALTSNGYGPFTTNKSVAVISPIGVHAAVTALALQTGVTIQATPTAVVTLRGLAISGLGGIDGIKVNIIGDLHIENCVVSNFSFKAIHFAFAHGRVFVSDSVIRENGGEAVLALGIDGSNQAAVLIERSRIVRNALGGPYGGVDARDFSNVIIRDSVVAGNFYNVRAYPNTLANGSYVWIENSILTGGSDGILANGANSLVRVMNTTITGNTGLGIQVMNGASVLSSGNNILFDNATDGAFTGMITPQ